MKKVVLSSALLVALVASGSSMAFAASPKPTIKSSNGAEGTATHEMSESSATQKKEGTSTGKHSGKKSGNKHASKKKVAKKKA
jgi:hypothetical protein